MSENFSGTPLGTEKGKEILAWAMSQEHAVLEFTQMDNGEVRVMPITDHVRIMEEHYRECDEVDA